MNEILRGHWERVKRGYADACLFVSLWFVVLACIGVAAYAFYLVPLIGIVFGLFMGAVLMIAWIIGGRRQPGEWE